MCPSLGCPHCYVIIIPMSHRQMRGLLPSNPPSSGDGMRGTGSTRCRHRRHWNVTSGLQGTQETPPVSTLLVVRLKSALAENGVAI